MHTTSIELQEAMTLEITGNLDKSVSDIEASCYQIDPAGRRAVQALEINAGQVPGESRQRRYACHLQTCLLTAMCSQGWLL